MMPIEIIQLLGFDGPNLYGPQPGVFLQIHAPKDRARTLKTALKDSAQSVGIVLGYLEIDSVTVDDGFVISAHFTTPAPAIGIEIARYVVEGLNRTAAGDQDWDAEAPLWELQKRRRAEALPLATLQLIAEASTRNIPAFVRADGQVQLGYGARHWLYNPANTTSNQLSDSSGVLSDSAIRTGPPLLAAYPVSNDVTTLAVPWDGIGPIPIIALAGGSQRDSAAQLVAARLDAQDQATGLATAADFADTRALLADAHALIAVVGLTAEGIAQRGIAFERCAFSAIIDLPDELPSEVADRSELARVLGVPMLVTDPAGSVVLNADVPEIVDLDEYAPCPIIYISARADNSIVALHCASGGRALFIRDGYVVAAQGTSEQIVFAASLPSTELAGALAGLAILWAVGISWDELLSTT